MIHYTQKDRLTWWELVILSVETHNLIFLTYSERSDDVNHSDRKFTTDLRLLWLNIHRISARGNIFELTSLNDSRIRRGVISTHKNKKLF